MNNFSIGACGLVAGWWLGSRATKDAIISASLMPRSLTNFGSIRSIKVSKGKQGSVMCSKGDDSLSFFYPSFEVIGKLSDYSQFDKIMFGITLGIYYLFKNSENRSEAEAYMSAAEQLFQDNGASINSLIAMYKVLTSDPIYAKLNQEKIQAWINALDKLGSVKDLFVANHMILRTETWIGVFREMADCMFHTDRYLKTLNLDKELGFHCPHQSRVSYGDVTLLATAAQHGSLTCFEERSDGNAILNSSSETIKIKVSGACKVRILAALNSKSTSIIESLSECYLYGITVKSMCAKDENNDSAVPVASIIIDKICFSTSDTVNVDRFIEILGQVIAGSYEGVKFLVNNSKSERNKAFQDLQAALNYLNNVSQESKDKLQEVWQMATRPIKKPKSDVNWEARFISGNSEPLLCPDMLTTISESFLEANESIILEAGEAAVFLPRCFDLSIEEVPMSYTGPVNTRSAQNFVEEICANLKEVDPSKIPIPVNEQFFSRRVAYRPGLNMLTSILFYDGKGGDYNSDNLGPLAPLLSHSAELLFDPNEFARRHGQFLSFFPLLTAGMLGLIANNQVSEELKNEFLTFQAVSTVVDSDSLIDLGVKLSKSEKVIALCKRVLSQVFTCTFTVPVRKWEIVPSVMAGWQSINRIDLICEVISIRVLAGCTPTYTHFKHLKTTVLWAIVLENLTNKTFSGELEKMIYSLKRRINFALFTSGDNARNDYILSQITSLSNELSDDVIATLLKTFQI